MIASQVALVVKNPPVDSRDARDAGLIPGSGKSPEGGHGNPLQYSCLENPTNRGAWQATCAKKKKSNIKWTKALKPFTKTQNNQYKTGF